MRTRAHNANKEHAHTNTRARAEKDTELYWLEKVSFKDNDYSVDNKK